jgi:hypothetical protein
VSAGLLTREEVERLLEPDRLSGTIAPPAGLPRFE